MAMKPIVGKMGSLHARVAVLEDEVASMREDMDRQKKMMPPMDINLNIPTAGPNSPVENRSPLDDWCVGYSPSDGAAMEQVQDGESPSEEVFPTMEAAHNGDLYWGQISHEDHDNLYQ
ncbi:hypothetical protein HAX54_036321, partial [Datura stramonium]|nr:hypothetical protein [Datura stramonium]